ncbi:alpha/beta fold hydrolase [Glutamicibacter sp. NPDC087344]|uniref:alpha/beta fold hydrolase n=1 Tax=Glutamicibacter sp. NPDC087344 TaxID=3363994 RepID=UPI0037F9569B
MSDEFVLVHSPLVGPSTWDFLAAGLRAGGHRVYVPDLRGTLAGGPPYLPRQTAAIAQNVGEKPAILVGHSGAGPLLPALGNSLNRVAGYVFIDATLPHPGRSWVEQAEAELGEQLMAMAINGWLPPWPQWWSPAVLAELLPGADLRDRFSNGCPRLPLKMFEEIQPVVTGWPDAPCAYLQLSQAYQDMAETSEVLGWPTRSLPSHHLAMLTDPELVLKALFDLVARI